ncbi:uncharacterized protein K444DRAFT_284457 [Hyaloscypha bicolor E]|uniref:Uncharacterized protein n=1 Tax=Hyaloscypha bicolor E TaxID=1095630 RepID=A0A2J6SGE7_9HELO|nr:uncharacterized protein K444DRAFT_284457 [Hyaloscypha bicolor E]PMD49852.1 hypothetical protein K444DRAFT_284457 [Hyaloscypha bicolor E]
MANPKKSYHLAPNFHIPATGPLTLGTIITSPSTPERTLTANPLPVSIPASQIYTSSQKNWSATRSSLSSYSGGVWTSFLASILGISADIEGDVKRETKTEYRVKELETRWFSPGEEFIGEVLKGGKVRRFMERMGFGKGVFMVVGIKVARGWSEGVSSGVKGIGGKVKVGVDGMVVGGVPVGVGPKGEVKREVKDGVSWEMGGEGEGEGDGGFVFAYRLVRIKRRGKEGGFKEEDFNKGALFEDEVGGGNDEENKWEWEDVRDGEGEGEDGRAVDVVNDDVE